MTRRPITTRHLPRLLAATLALFPFAHAQQTPLVPQTIKEALHQMSDSAGVIFVGEVTAIRSLPGDNGTSGIIEIDFRVDQAVRGCTASTTYTCASGQASGPSETSATARANVFCENGLESGDRKCLSGPRKSLVGHPGATNFLRVFRGWVFQHP